ncbi:methyltransferase [Campylobacter troglodytis]|uniref:methyltransferase n=1 Tax=Campylobacter troglodytis TaxID=654363 RepID=UPI001FECCDAA|nr:methyltransferase [Campylobacter troglodytis]TQR55824.1 hypothetical protein DMC01_09560 [Campylobacter troglodytis]
MLNEKIEISLDETHHTIGDTSLYAKRYAKVLSFHNGIAPVYEIVNKDKNLFKAFFIDINNTKLFGREFQKAFGFYEGLACVCDESGFYHILENGKDAYNKRFLWCGNFVEKACVVKNSKGKYFHIDIFGEPLYRYKFEYVGDYKYGIAVALLKNGKCIHILKNGKRLHNKEYEFLEPFHKGLAIAKDEKGYFHIDKSGSELYKQRYAKLEPFYNGKAFGLNFDGNKILLDESCIRIKSQSEVLSNINKDFIKNRISNEAFSFFKTRILYSILELNVLESLKGKLKIELEEYPKNLIIQWLITNGYINKNLKVTTKGNIALNLKPLISYWQNLPFIASLDLEKSLKENTEYFSKRFGMPYFNYILNKTHKSEAQKFSFISNFYTKDYDISALKLNDETVCDIGCGSGILLDKIHKKFPHIKTIYADKEDFRIFKRKIFKKIDFFKPLYIKADVFIISRILHDWDDKNAIKILKNISKCMDKNSVLLVFEAIVEIDKMDSLDLCFHLLNFLGGKERSLKEFEDIFNKSNLKIENIIEGSLINIIKVRKK